MKTIGSLFRTLFVALPPTIERPSPKIRVTSEQADAIFKALKLIPGYENCYIAAIAPTNSEDPCIDDGMYVIMDAGVSYTDIIPGDIIYYKTMNFEAIHRVIEVGEEDSGEWYCKTKGDNNGANDPGLVRKEDIKGVWRITIN